MLQAGLIWSVLIWSLIILLTGFVPLVHEVMEKRRFYRRNPHKYYAQKYSFTTRLLLLTLCIFVSVWLMRYTVGYFSSFYQFKDSGLPCDDIGQLGTGFRESVNSLLHALQTFSMDEDYTGYWLNAQFMMEQLTGNSFIILTLLHLIMAATNILAPVVGGAIVFEMLTKAFPSVRLYLCGLQFWKPKYYFSELNENSIALARSLLSDPEKRSCTLIFTDAYQDDEEKQSTELLLEARSMGAICLKSDLLHIAFKHHNRAGSFVFLIDKDENTNVGILANMLKETEIKTYENAIIYVFSTDRKYSCIEDDVINMINIVKDRMNAADREPKPKMPYVLPINIIRNTADDLLQEVPLFEPLIGSDRKELTVTILGGGSIGTEMFLAVYRYGQLLDRKLNVHVISREEAFSADSSETGFCNRINYINPEILRTAHASDDLLRINCDPAHPEYADPYLHFTYHSADILSDGFTALLEQNEELLHSDYFIVTLGTDEDNLNTADHIKRIVGKDHALHNASRRTVIAYSVYNTDLCRQLNEKKTRSYRQSGETDIVLHAFGCKDEVYSLRNVLREDVMKNAYVLYQKYRYTFKKSDKADKKKAEQALEKTYAKYIKDVYNSMSSGARSMHLPYKVFSAGLWKPELSVFAPPLPAEERDALYREMEASYHREWIRAPLSTEQDYQQNAARLHRMAWLEHRRWNAFMRTCGFRTMTYEEMEQIYPLMAFEHPREDHKHLGLKLHPCLVECTQTGIHKKLDQNGEVPDGETEGFDAGKAAAFDSSRLPDGSYDLSKLTDFDLLDLVSYHLRYLKMKEKDAILRRTEPPLTDSEKENKLSAIFIYDFKKWDYPSEEPPPKLRTICSK